MKIRQMALLLVCCAAFFMLAACAKKEPQTATVSLPSNPTTGYSWKVTQSNEIFDITSEYVQGEGGAVGAGGYETFTLTPTGSGEDAVIFEYGRSWEEGAASEVTYNISVDKQMQIKVNSFKGSLPGTSEEMPDIPQIEIK